MPSAVRACRPASGPNTSFSRFVAPLMTRWQSAKSGSAFTYPVTRTTRATASSEPSLVTIARRMLAAHSAAAVVASATDTCDGTFPLLVSTPAS